jgi:hypothetical protein
MNTVARGQTPHPRDSGSLDNARTSSVLTKPAAGIERREHCTHTHKEDNIERNDAY